MMTVEELIKEMRHIFMIPVLMIVLSTIFKIIKDIMQGAYLGDIRDELEKKADEMIKEEEQKITIDKDLEKYFNYKE